MNIAVFLSLGYLYFCLEAFTIPPSSLRRRVAHLFRHRLDGVVKPDAVLVHHPQSLLEGLLEAAADSHHLAWIINALSTVVIHPNSQRRLLTDALHGASDLGGDPQELAQIPARHLHYTIVQTGLKISRG